MSKKPKLIIVGAGFGGIALAKRLKNKPVDVLLLDKNNYHTFQPLLYQVATAGLEPGSIAYPIRRILRKFPNIQFRMAEVHAVDTASQKLETSIGALDYDYLVIATGSTNNFFSLQSKSQLLMPLKSVPDAINIRSLLLQNLEHALTMPDRESKQEAINIAIAGGGPTGLELAGALAEMKKYVLPKEFPELDTKRMQIHLFEASDKLLAHMSKESSTASLKYLKSLGVQVKVATKVKDFDGQKVILDNGNEFHTNTLIWTAGVKANPIAGLESTTIVGANRIAVDPYNRVLNYQNIFAIGDVAAFKDANFPNGLPMLAPVAMQQGKHLAQNILTALQGLEMQPFIYNNKGTMATIGRNKAVVDFIKIKFQGTFAWFIWLFVHLMSLVSFRNKLVTLIDWIHNYVSYDRPHDIIIHKFKRKQDES
ncbi:NAD(P)/FAD-dependent oxidoreductase [candidate division KSB1 bacterium]|nr:NAD(P)/FAD-dependent oxidoreductase [candidate division KSB1 bacterium]